MGRVLEDQLTDDIYDESGGRRYTDPYVMPGDNPEAGTTGQVKPPANQPPVVPTAPQQNYRIQPVDQAKFNDPNHKTGKYDFLRIAQKYNPQSGIQGGMVDELNQLGYGNFSGSGQHLRLSGVTDAGRNAGIDPHDFEGDFIQNWGEGKNPDAQWAWDWYDPNTGRTSPQPTSQASIPVGGGGGGGGGGIGGNIDAGAGRNTGLEEMISKMLADQERARAEQSEYNKRIRGTVLSQIEQGGAPVDENDPIMMAQKRAFGSEQDRGVAQAREAMAQRAAHEGLPTGALDSGIQGTLENAANTKGAYSANLMSERLKQKQQQLQDALHTGAGILTADEARDLQTKLAAIDARIKQMDLTQSGQVANRGLDLQGGQLDLANRSENDRMNMFYDQMGLDIGQRESGLNQAMMQMLMGR